MNGGLGIPDPRKRVLALMKRARESMPKVQEQAIQSGDFSEVERASKNMDRLLKLAQKMSEAPPPATNSPAEPPADDGTTSDTLPPLRARARGSQRPQPQPAAPTPPADDAFPAFEGAERARRDAKLTSDERQLTGQDPTLPPPPSQPAPAAAQDPLLPHIQKRAAASKAVMDAFDEVLDSMKGYPLLDVNREGMRMVARRDPANAVRLLETPRFMDWINDALAGRRPSWDKLESAVRAYQEVADQPDEAALQKRTAEEYAEGAFPRFEGLKKLHGELSAQKTIGPTGDAEKARKLDEVSEQMRALEQNLQGATPPATKAGGPDAPPPSLIVPPSETEKKPTPPSEDIKLQQDAAEAFGNDPQRLVDDMAKYAADEYEAEFLRRVKMELGDKPPERSTFERVMLALLYGLGSLGARWATGDWRTRAFFPDFNADATKYDERKRQIGREVYQQVQTSGRAREAQAAATSRKRLELSYRALRDKALQRIAGINALTRRIEATNRQLARELNQKGAAIATQVDAEMAAMRAARNPLDGTIDEAAWNAAYQRIGQLAKSLEDLAQEYAAAPAE